MKKNYGLGGSNFSAGDIAVPSNAPASVKEKERQNVEGARALNRELFENCSFHTGNGSKVSTCTLIVQE